jgi:hypothetical protein
MFDNKLDAGLSRNLAASLDADLKHVTKVRPNSDKVRFTLPLRDYSQKFKMTSCDTANTAIDGPQR